MPILHSPTRPQLLWSVGGIILMPLIVAVGILALSVALMAAVLRAPSGLQRSQVPIAGALRRVDVPALSPDSAVENIAAPRFGATATPAWGPAEALGVPVG